MKETDNFDLEMPFAYGKVAENKDFVGREKDIEHLMTNFKGHINTTNELGV